MRTFAVAFSNAFFVTLLFASGNREPISVQGIDIKVAFILAFTLGMISYVLDSMITEVINCLLVPTWRWLRTRQYKTAH